MADTYSKLLGLSETQTPPTHARKATPVKTLHPKTEEPSFAEPNKATPSPVSASPPPKKQNTLTKKTDSRLEEMSTNPQTGKPIIPSPPLGLVEKPEKYTTHLEPSLVKQLKLFAVEKDLKDYQVIKNALLLYFKQNK
jgi:hypothetical protein